MITEVFIDLEKVFNGLGNIKQAKCVSNFYDWLNSNQQEQFIAEILEDADDDVLIDELKRRGYIIEKDD